VLNAGDRGWVARLGEVVAAIAARPETRVAVLTGAGRAFSTGVDLTALAHGDFALADFVAWEDAMTAMERMDVLWIAAINGHCVGGGLQLTLVCDHRLVVEDALLGLPAVKEALIPSMSLYRLPRLIGLGRAQELILTGVPIGGREAERIGLVHRAVPAADFAKALDEAVERYLALPRTSAVASRQLLAQVFELGFDDFRAKMQERLAACMASPEHARAMEEIRKNKARR
jgi:enoyl-CoA hydratase/carnithine racemase